MDADGGCRRDDARPGGLRVRAARDTPGRDAFDAWRRRILPLRVLGAVVGVAIAVSAPSVSRALADAFGRPESALFPDVVRHAIPTLAALPFLRMIAYRRRDALLVYFIPLAGIWLLGRIGWRLPALRHPDWPPRPEAARPADAAWPGSGR